MAAMKSVIPLVAMLIAVLVVPSQLITQSQAQTCSSTLASLNVCIPYVFPGAFTTAPGPECCRALQAVDHDCLCSTLRIASRITALCNLPPVNCAN